MLQYKELREWSLTQWVAIFCL